MRVKDIAVKFGLDRDAFENFCIESSSIETSGLANISIDDDQIERAVTLFKLNPDERVAYLENEEKEKQLLEDEEKENALKRVADRMKHQGSYSYASGANYHYVVLQVTLKEKFIGTGSGNLSELEDVINRQARKGYRLHTITTANGGSKGLGGGDRIQATMVFEKIETNE